jgi:hypothetical protein
MDPGSLAAKVLVRLLVRAMGDDLLISAHDSSQFGVLEIGRIHGVPR